MIKMQKKLWGSLAAAVIVLGGGYGLSEAQAAKAGSTGAAVQDKALIGIAKAEANALKEAKGIVVSVDLEKKLSGTYYDVEIRKDHQEIEVRLDAYTGKTVKVRKETDKDDDDFYRAGSQNGTLISAGQAAAAAAASAKGTVTEVDLDEDDGILLYEVKIRNGKTETEIGVDASSAKILYTDVDHDDDED
ncbi:PepSY domain-containing protein [Paenibacillus tengchongensis]|uniref:PepSY domain-containing protein n=1 Tax=Paenibacillus tengchongensis TaxID=2608684 RepID=UPI00124C1503|nr:PepSY domain-containing protein [Paenibacillus tengchongensis]